MCITSAEAFETCETEVSELQKSKVPSLMASYQSLR
jgi:hypothetical protein